MHAAWSVKVRMFYGWKIVGVSFLTHFISVGFIFYSYGVFFKALTAEFGGSRFGTALGLVFMNVTIACTAPMLGRMLDRGSIRAILCSGAVSMAIGFFLLSQITALWQFYLVLATFLGLGEAMLGPIPSSTIVANWFIRRRGTALGVATMGISLSGVVMAPVSERLIQSIGWRYTFDVYGVTALAVVVPVVWFFVINRPEDLGMNPDGVPGTKPLTLPKDSAGERRIQSVDDWNTAAILKNDSFWIIAVVVGLNFSANGAILTHIVAHANDIGHSTLRSALVLTVIASLGVAGKVIFGYIADFIDKRIAFWLIMVLQATGCYLLMHSTAYWALLASGAVFGLGMGGIVPLMGTLVGAVFGRRVFGRVMGLLNPCMLPIQSIGIPLAGYIYDQNGNYDLAFRLFVGVYVIAIAVLTLLKLPGEEPGESIVQHEEARATTEP